MRSMTLPQAETDTWSILWIGFALALPIPSC